MKFNPKQSWIDVYRKDPAEAWQTFLELYENLIRRVIHKLVDDYDERMELYTYSLEQLKENNSRKLLSYFGKKRGYNFETWIAVVVRNCCMDWFRKEQGRKRILKCIEELSLIDQEIFRLLYHQGYSRPESFELLRARHEQEISFEDFCSRADQIEQAIHQKTRWKLSREWIRSLPPLSLDPDDTMSTRGVIPDDDSKDDPSPEEQLIQSDSKNALLEAFKTLSPEQRLIVHLHFYRGLTLKQIARVLRMKNIWQVHRRLHKALKQLREEFRKKNIDLSDL